MRLKALAIAALLSLPFQIGCDFDTFGNSDRYREDFEYTYDLKPGGRISLETFNGSVEVLSWEKQSVQITGTKYSSREDDLRDIRIDIQSGADSLRIRAVRPSRRGNMGAKFFLRVPKQVELDRIISSNGGIRVEDVEGNARLETSNGGIRLRSLTSRTLDARTSNGGIEGSEIEGDAVLRTSNGGIRLDRVRGGLDAHTTNAGIRIHLTDPRPNQPVRLESSNGGIELTLDEIDNNEIRASTSNSSITLRLPETLKAQLRAHTSNSSVTTDFDVETRGGRINKNHLEGDINGGGPLIDLSTSNGPIRVLKP